MVDRRGGPSPTAGTSKAVLLLGEFGDWPPDVDVLLAREGYSGDRVARLDVVPPLLARGAVDALLMPAQRLGASDIIALRRIRETSPRTAIVVVTPTPSDPDVKRAFESGATAFLSWPASSNALRHAIESGRVGSFSGRTGRRA